MALHGSSWYTNPEFDSKLDILYVHAMMPVYCHEANFLISNSSLTTNDYIKYLHVNETKIATVPLAAGEEFVPIKDRQVLDDIKNKYKFPDNFILTLTSYEEKRKNFYEIQKQHNNVLLLIVGSGENLTYSCDSKLKEYVRGKILRKV